MSVHLSVIRSPISFKISFYRTFIYPLKQLAEVMTKFGAISVPTHVWEPKKRRLAIIGHMFVERSRFLPHRIAEERKTA